MSSNPSTKSDLKIRVFLIVAIAVAILHFCFIVVYSFRDNMPGKLNTYADRYTVPMFHQYWKLFAPDLPTYNVELEYRYAQNPGWSEWRDASASFGYDASSRIETIEQRFNTSLGWQVLNNFYSRDGRKQYDRMVQSADYASALFFVLKMHELHVDPHPLDSVQLRMNFRFTPPPDKAYTFQNSILEFPVFKPIP